MGETLQADVFSFLPRMAPQPDLSPRNANKPRDLGVTTTLSSQSLGVSPERMVLDGLRRVCHIEMTFRSRLHARVISSASMSRFAVA
jgi:hypothetical protein